MDLTFLNHLREIMEEDERIVTMTLLIDICSNLIQDRTNQRHHTLPKNYIQEIFQKYSGAMKCLQLIGFEQIKDDYVFNQITSNEQLKEIIRLLENELESKSCNDQMKCSSIDLGIIENDQSINLPISFPNLHIPTSFNDLIPFVSTLKLVQSYEDRNLCQYILSSILPLEEFHRKISRRQTSTDVEKRDLLLLELLQWFKEEFFTWFNQPNCDRCHTPMKSVGYTQPTREEREQGHAHRVEFYRCSTCSSEYRFPRYNAPLKLLETRTGRCGEAANLFTCLCRALSFRARYVHDTTDHVWTEVYSENEHRWLHCDACENLCDSPLVYDQGWKKQLLFCIAFAKDHVEDVTWRYVTNFKQARQRRNINEKAFARTIERINHQIQSQMNQEERKTVVSMRVKDVVSMLSEQKITKDSELHGRQSGSLAWKLSRKETDQQDDITNGYIYSITNEECEKGLISIEYNSVKDIYYRNGGEENKKDGWINKVYSSSNIQRKVERDWKMVYLSRKQLHSNGILSWLIQLKPEEEKSYRLDRIKIQCPSTTFDHHAKVLYQLQIGDELTIDFHFDSNSSFEYIFDEKTNSLSNIRIGIKVILTSSNDNNDDNAWQKAQLFRQSTDQVFGDDQSHFLRINLSFQKKTF